MTAGRGPVTFWGFIHHFIQNLLDDVVLSGPEALFYEYIYQHYIRIRAMPDPMYPKKSLFMKSYIILFRTKNPMYGLSVTIEGGYIGFIMPFNIA